MTPLLLLLLLPGDGWVTIPAGQYDVGCEPKQACPEGETPRTVTLDSPLEVMKTEVTVGEFLRFVKATGHKTLPEQQGQPWTWSKARAYQVKPKMPVAHVTLRDAEAYCAWAGARLPTDSEWTVASRAPGEPKQGHLCWTFDPSRVWARENSGGHPHEVGRLLPNGWGLHDMEGNVWEYALPDNPAEAMPAKVRGGGWVTCQIIEGKPQKNPVPSIGRFTRLGFPGDLARDDIGFRCVRVQSRD
jgi:formylglycine-generating enzyme required for sulfatase activity